LVKGDSGLVRDFTVTDLLGCLSKAKLSVYPLLNHINHTIVIGDMILEQGFRIGSLNRRQSGGLSSGKKSSEKSFIIRMKLLHFRLLSVNLLYPIYSSLGYFLIRTF